MDNRSAGETYPCLICEEPIFFPEDDPVGTVTVCPGCGEEYIKVPDDQRAIAANEGR